MGLGQTIKIIANYFKKLEEEIKSESNYEPFEIESEYSTEYCPVREKTPNGLIMGRCWIFLENNQCKTHGQINYKKNIREKKWTHQKYY